jgi:hypothetical protein
MIFYSVWHDGKASMSVITFHHIKPQRNAFILYFSASVKGLLYSPQSRTVARFFSVAIRTSGLYARHENPTPAHKKTANVKAEITG